MILHKGTEMNYGAPYKGSKNAIADKIIDALPAAVNFYDLFAGGCAITHAAALSGKWKNLYANDIDGSGIRLFRDAIAGKYKDEKRWISREDFFRLKDVDPYVKFCWSFGNNGKCYLYGRDIEEQKRRCHFARVFHDAVYEDAKLKLQSLESLQRIQRLQGICKKSPIIYSFADYRQVNIKENSVVYCDIPYRYTSKYFNEFDYDAFFAWALKNERPFFISEYNMPNSFHKIFSIKKCVLINPKTNSIYKAENLYANDAAYAIYREGDLFYRNYTQINKDGK